METISLEMINVKTKLSALLGLRSNRRIVFTDKGDSVCGIEVSSEIGLPVLAGSGIKSFTIWV